MAPAGSGRLLASTAAPGNLKKRRAARRTLALGPFVSRAAGGLSVLERRAVSTTIQQRYLEMLHRLDRFVNVFRLAVRT